MRLFPASFSVAEKIQWSISQVLRASLVFAFIEALISHNWLGAFVSILTLALTFVPALIEHNYRIYLPVELEFLTVVFVYASMFLGESYRYFSRFWWWDVVLHASSGLAIGMIGFLVLFILYRRHRIAASPLLIAVFAFSFALAIGALWEIFEFTWDQVFGTALQQSGLVDTMSDLIIDATAAGIAALAGYHYLKHHTKGMVDMLVKKILSQNPHLLKNRYNNFPNQKPL